MLICSLQKKKKKNFFFFVGGGGGGGVSICAIGKEKKEERGTSISFQLKQKEPCSVFPLLLYLQPTSWVALLNAENTRTEAEEYNGTYLEASIKNDLRKVYIPSNTFQPLALTSSKLDAFLSSSFIP